MSYSRKVRFYKGPFHNKSRLVWEHHHHIDVTVSDPVRVTNWASDGLVMPIVSIHRYRRTLHTHPDGSVFFVYEGKVN